jgi:Na+-transporting NADH:ubiquinone oxidoreductase subunit NqrE
VSAGLRWTLAIVAVALIVSLVAYARGTAHHRGIDVGVHAGASTGLGHG